MTARTNDRLPPLCYIAHPTTGATVAIHPTRRPRTTSAQCVTAR
jgi:hypothetical protein